MFTKMQLQKQLADLGVPKNSVILAHFSLRAVGETEGRGEGLLEALAEYCTAEGGLFCVPTHTWKNLDDLTLPTLDLSSDKTCIGTMSSIAARHPNARRSLHPTHSMAVFGEWAEEYIAPEVYVNTSTAPEGCYGRLADQQGYVLLVGVGHDRNTYLHSVEERMNVPNRLSEDAKAAWIRMKTGEIRPRPLHCHCAVGIGDVSARYPKYEPAFRYHGCIRDGFIGNAPAQLCDAVGMMQVMMRIRERSGGAELLQDFEPLDPFLYE